MGFDVRLALGGFFVFVGLLLTAFGAASPAALFQRSLGLNVDLWWGLVLLVFGAAMLALAARSRRTRARRPDGSRACVGSRGGSDDAEPRAH